MASNSQGAGDPMDVDSQGTGVPMGVDALGTGLPTNVDPLDNPQPLPSPVIKVPRLPAGPDAVLKDMRRRMSSKVTWFVQGLSLKSRYYARQPSERIPYPDGADSDPLDVLVLLKDIGNVSREELVQQITEQVNQTREYSRDTEWETGTYRRLQANPLAADFLRDVDTLIEELRRMEAEMRMNDQTAAVTRLFSTICETLGWDPKSIRDTGLQHELMGAVSLTWSARLRWMKGIVNKKHLVEEGVKPEELEVYDRQQNTMNNLVEHVNRRLHGPALRPDVRAIEYMCNWAASLVARDRDGWESHPRLTPEYARFLFEHSYEIPYATAVVLSRSRQYP
ncbi:hypothetical protein F4677DRAFT_140805 [Hypoxylon crocopeplum]|nr:hypothetical protein F4677DRAFT_140805 [Hypoxylon crocopeplum]